MDKQELKERETRITELAVALCHERLDEECAELCTKLVQKLGRKRTCPLQSGRLEIWAAAVYTICSVNFMFSKDSRLSTSSYEIAEYFGASGSTIAQKSRVVKDLLKIVLFVVIPLAAGVITRIMVIRRKGVDYFNNVFIKKFDNYTVGGLLLTLIILFSFQGETILNNPLHILLIAVPLVLQTVLIFFVAYGWARWWKLPHEVAAPAGMIGASNFFELAVAVAISLFGLQSGAALATVVGVLVEVPVMLVLVIESTSKCNLSAKLGIMFEKDLIWCIEI